MKYVTKPIEIRAHQWTDTFDSYRAIAALIGVENIRHAAPGGDHKIEIWNHLEKVWFPVYDNAYVIRGLKNEAYACDPEVFNAKYELKRASVNREKPVFEY